MAKITGSSNRSKRSTKKPVTQGEYPQRSNRQRVSQAKVTSAEARKPSPRSAGINQGKGAGRGRVTGTQGRPKPATPAKVTTGSKISRLAHTVTKAARAAKTAVTGSRALGALRAAAPLMASPLGAAAAGTGALAAYGVSEGEVKRTKAAGTFKQTNRRGGGSVAGQQRASRAKAAAAGSTSQFKGARDTAFKKAAAIKGSPVVGPKKASSGKGGGSFDSAFAAARKSGKKEFTWRGKRYNTKLRGEK